MRYTVEAAGITKAFGDDLVLDNVDLTVETGAVLALLGPNGAGKTTLVRILSTLLEPDAGTATIAGHDLLTDPMGVKRSISLTGQFAAVDDLLSGRENLTMMAQLRHLPRNAVRARVQELLSEFELESAASRRASTYSGGMRRRLDLAMGMIERPQLLFLDEPTTGLDPRSREELWGAIRGLVADGVTVMLTTQYLEEADQLADTIMVIDRGRIAARGTATELKANLGGEILRLEFTSQAEVECAVGLIDGEVIDNPLFALEVAADGTADFVRATLDRLAAAGVPAIRLAIRRPSLDDVFLHLTGEGALQSSSRDAA